MALSWISAHEWSENHSKVIDKDLQTPPKSVIKELMKEKNETKKVKLKSSDKEKRIILCKNKLIEFSIKNINNNFKMIEVTRQFSGISPHHYVRLYSMASKELSLQGYKLIKNGPWYKCVKER